MPRDGATIFGDLIGKLDTVLWQVRTLWPLSAQSNLRSLPLCPADGPQGAGRLVRTMLARNKSGSGRDHMPGRLHRCVSTIAQIHCLEHGDGMIGVLQVIRIINHDPELSPPKEQCEFLTLPEGPLRVCPISDQRRGFFYT